MSSVFSGGVDVFGVSDVGLKRTRNEDHFVIATLRKEIASAQTALTVTCSHTVAGANGAHIHLGAPGVQRLGTPAVHPSAR